MALWRNKISQKETSQSQLWPFTPTAGASRTRGNSRALWAGAWDARAETCGERVLFVRKRRVAMHGTQQSARAGQAMATAVETIIGQGTDTHARTSCETWCRERGLWKRTGLGDGPAPKRGEGEMKGRDARDSVRLAPMRGEGENRGAGTSPPDVRRGLPPAGQY